MSPVRESPLSRVSMIPAKNTAESARSVSATRRLDRFKRELLASGPWRFATIWLTDSAIVGSSDPGADGCELFTLSAFPAVELASRPKLRGSSSPQVESESQVGGRIGLEFDSEHKPTFDDMRIDGKYAPFHLICAR